MSNGTGFGLGRLKIPTKLAILVAALGIVAVALAATLVRRQLADLGSVRVEQRGLGYLRQMHGLFQHLQQHRSAASMALIGQDSADLAGLRDVVSTDFESLAALEQQLGNDFGTAERLAAVQRNWSNIANRFDRLDAQQSFDAHGRLLEDVIELALTVGESSGLRTTSDLASFYLSDVTLSRLFEASEDLGLLQVEGIRLADSGFADAELQRSLTSRASSVELEMDAIERNLELAFVQGFGLRQEGESVWRTADNRASVFLAFVEQELTRPPLADTEGDSAPGVTPAAVLAAGNEALTAMYALANAELDSLERRLGDRFAELRLQLILALAGLAIGFVLSGVLAFLIARGLTRQLRAITGTLTQIGIGNFGARADVLTQDELGTVAQSLNGMLSNTLTLIQSRAERDAQQTSIMKLLDEVSGVAEGDLTRDAEVTPEITGAIADAFNFMLGELRRLVGDIQTTSAEVGDAAEGILEKTSSLASGSENQSRRITEAAESIQGMAASMKSVSRGASQAAEVAQRSLTSALRGARAVDQTASGMQNVRQEVQATSKRIKRLGETSQEVGEIARLINEIADRTGMLALNASIQAASAGEAGRGFAVVAAEVERLAVRAADATKRIDELISTIQVETKEVVVAMEDTTREVVEGSTLASEAGETLAEIESVSKELAELVATISESSTQQASTSERVAHAMSEISDVSLETASGSRDAATSVRGLAALVARLRDSVKTFKLPEAPAA